jgi:hypothetical protein
LADQVGERGLILLLARELVQLAGLAESLVDAREVADDGLELGALAS